jgi:hypothetical protein
LRWLPEPGADKLQFVADQAPGPAWEQRQPEAGATRKRILLVDDNADMRDYVRGLLGRSYEVLAVADGGNSYLKSIMIDASDALSRLFSEQSLTLCVNRDRQGLGSTVRRR